MTTETIREAVARAIFEQEGYCSGADDDPFAKWTWEEAVAEEYPVLAAKAYDMADAAIRTVLERLREPGDDILEVGQNVCNAAYLEPDEVPADAYFVWQAMLDAAVRGALPEPADSGRG